MDKARIIYDRYLFHYFPQQKVLVLPHDKTIASSDVDIAIVKHILWHVRNDSFLELELAERELLTRALMIRLTSSHTRQVSVMAKKIAKQFNRDKEQEVVKYLKEKMDEIGWILFGTNKGFVYQARLFIVFRNDRRKRAFVEDAVPVVLHILEHLGAGELSEKIKSAADSMRWKNACKIDGLLFKSPSPAIKHVLDAHIDIVELSALDMVLEDNGLLEIFRDALSVVFADQAWQLEEALGFKGYEMKPCSKANFLNDESNGVNHQPESLHPCDPRDPPASCACADSVSSQSEALGASADSSQYLRSRIKTVCHGMPEASAVCYEEFLHESEVHNDEEDSSCVGIAEDGSMVDAMTSKSSLILPSSTVCVNSTVLVPPAVPLVSIKVEESEERDDLNNLSGEVQNSSSSPTNFLSNSDPLLRRRKAEQRRKKNISRRIGQKRSVEVKHEPEESVPTASNTALPVKSAIEGSKTAAAALAATLRTGSGYTDTYGQPRNPIGRTQDNSMSDSSDAEDSDLALGNISKRPRLLVGGDVEGDISGDISFQAFFAKRRIQVPSSHSKSVSSDTPEKK
uniref:HTH myb-type domain-containing protein n=1 Tax=Angiostrongylus cantonensis TaxID=6313 RepID=A0A0K0DP12_ANGCA